MLLLLGSIMLLSPATDTHLNSFNGIRHFFIEGLIVAHLISELRFLMEPYNMAPSLTL
jgi:hypothetical protein